MKKAKGYKAWLITSEGSGQHAARQNKVVEILDPRLPAERVRQIVESLYHRDATLSEKVAWRLRKQRQPYPAEYTALEGVPWAGEITCGHNPYLRARLVDDLVIETDSQGNEHATWKDRHHPSEIRNKIRRIKSER